MYYHKKYGVVAKEKRYAPAPGYLLRRARVLALASKLQPGKLLEVGCGAGGLLCDLAARGFSCTATETSVAARELAKYLTTSSGYQIPILDKVDDRWSGQFSYVFSFEVLEHIEHDEETLKQWFGLLKEDGYLVMSVPALMKKWGIEDTVVGHYRRYERDELISKLEAAGFQCEHIENWGFPLVPMIRPFRKIKYRNYMKAKTDAAGSYDKSAGSAMSGINRDLETKLYPILETWPGLFVMWFFDKLQRVFRNTDLGDGYIVLAKKIKK